MKQLHLFIVVFAIIIISLISCKSKQIPIIAVGATPVQVSGDFLFTEGPASDSEGNVYFTDQPNNRIMLWSTTGEISVFMDECGRSNGLFFNNNGFLLACADENNQLWQIDTKTNEVQILIDQFEGRNLNGPNDLWVDAKGGIYFTDPNYKRAYWKDSVIQVENENVYYILPDKNSIVVVENNIIKPNGIIGSADGKSLFVADIGDNKTYKYQIHDDGFLSNRTLFCEMGSDGMTIDELGNIYLSGKGVYVFNADGVQIEHIAIDEEWTANVTFGGSDFKTLFITAMNSIYTLKMNIKGIK